MPNPTRITGTTNSAAISSGTSATVSSTGSVTAGNLQIVMIEVGGASAPSAITAPAGGWTTFLTTTVTASSGLIVAAIFYKRATASGSFSGAFTWTGTATSGEWLFTEWSGAGALLVDGTVGTTLNVSGTSPTAPSVTPGAGNVNDTLVSVLFAGAVGASQANAPTIPAGMSSILTVASASGTDFFGCASLALASSAATGAKTWTLAHANTAMGASFLIQQGPLWGWDIQPWQPPNPGRNLPRRSATRGASDFGGWPRWVNAGWEIQSVQPGHPRPERSGAIARGDDGTEAPFVPPAGTPLFETPPLQPPYPRTLHKYGILDIGDQGNQQIFIGFQPYGWEVQPPQPPHPTPERRAAAVMRGDDGTEQILIGFQPYGWEIAPHQPGHPRYRTEFKDDGIAASFVNWKNAGWEIAPHQPGHPRPERSGAIAKGDDGTEATFIPVNPFFETPLVFPRKMFRLGDYRDDGIAVPFALWQNAGWEVQPPQPGHPRPERSAVRERGDDGIEQILFGFQPSGWEIQSMQPSHPRPERSGALARGDDGIENIFAVPFIASYETPSVFPRKAYKIVGWSGFGDDGIQAPLLPWFNAGWEIAPYQPGHPRPERNGAIARGDDGTEGLLPAVTNIVLPVTEWTFCPQPPYPRWNQRYGTEGLSEIPIFPPWVQWNEENDTAYHWPFAPGRKSPETGDPGIASPFVFVTPQLAFVDVQSVQPGHPRYRTDFKDDGIALPFSRWFNAGWEIQPPQPGHPRPERSGSIARGDDGTEGPYALWFNAGWEIQPPPPPHPKALHKYGIFDIGDGGNEAPFVMWNNAGWEIQSVQPPQPRALRKYGVEDVGDQGAEAPLISFQPYGWEVPPHQPGHPRPERSGVLAQHYDGTEGTFSVLVIPLVNQFETPGPFTHIRYPRWNQRYGVSGLSMFSFPPQWVNAGWEIPPPMLRPKIDQRRSATRGKSGFFAPQFVVPSLAPFPNWGFEQQPLDLLPRQSLIARREGARGESAWLAPPTWINAGWEIQSFQPPHQRPERQGALARGDDGVGSAFVAPPVPLVFVNWGLEIPPPHLRVPVLARYQAICGESTWLTPPLWFNLGWEVQPFQPPYPRALSKYGILDIGDQGNQFPATKLPAMEWTNVPQPPHKFWSRGWAAIYSGHVGLELPFVPPPPPTPGPGGLYIWHHRGRRGRA